MADNKRLALRGTLGLLGVSALAMGLIAGFWLPANGAKLDDRKNRLQDRITRFESTVRNQQYAEQHQIHPVDALPPVSALPGKAGELLEAIGAAGAEQLGYKLGADEKYASLMNLTVTFYADVPAMGAILDRVALQRPAVSMSSMDLDRDDDGRIEATLKLTLLGKSDA